jgi:hypothetical protein
MYGKPVLWVDETETLTPIPVNPPSPTWNDATSQIVVPSGVVGVDYVATSGGGLVPSTILTQGSTVSTTGAFPRTVVITPVAQPGHVLATGGLTFHHDFPDPAALIVLASDGFSGGDTASIGGRAMDLAAGGSATNWPAGAYFGITSGSAVTTTTAGGYYFTYASVDNFKVEANVSALSPSGAGKYQFYFYLRGFTLFIGAGAMRINGPTSTATPVLLTQVAAQPIGTWSIQIYGTTLTVIKGDGTTLVFDLNQPQNSGTYIWTGLFADRIVGIQNDYTSADADTATLDNFKITKVGF